MWIGLLACYLSACDEVTPQSYAEMVEGARACESNEDCVLAGEGPCTCAAPINAASQEEIDEAAECLDCDYVTTTDCPANENLRCEAERCVTDDSP
jgi:hypothetical protein